jgi:hypothetical protein
MNPLKIAFIKFRTTGILTIIFFLVISSGNAGTVFHGSSALFESPKPMLNTRYGKNGEVIWRGEGVFGTRDRRIALVYTNSRGAGYFQGVDLTHEISPKEPLAVIVGGGKTEEETLEHLYGTEIPNSSYGYIYCMDDGSFTREAGLGVMEVVSRNPVLLFRNSECPDGIQTINRRQEFNHYLHLGLIQFHWVPPETLQKEIKK